MQPQCIAPRVRRAQGPLSSRALNDGYRAAYEFIEGHCARKHRAAWSQLSCVRTPILRMFAVNDCHRAVLGLQAVGWHLAKSRLCAVAVAKWRQNSRSSRCCQDGGYLEPRHQGRRLHLCRRHARHRSVNQHIGAGPSSTSSSCIPQYKVDCSIGGRQPTGLHTAHCLRQ